MYVGMTSLIPSESTSENLLSIYLRSYFENGDNGYMWYLFREDYFLIGWSVVS